MTENWGKLSSVNLVARHTVVMDCTARSAHACGWLVLYIAPPGVVSHRIIPLAK